MARSRAGGKKEKERDPVLVAEGRAIARAMAKKGVDRTQLAEHFELTDAAVGYWLRGDVPVPLHKRKELIRFLEMEPESLNFAIQVVQASEAMDAALEAGYNLAMEVATMDVPTEVRLAVKEVLKTYQAAKREANG